MPIFDKKFWQKTDLLNYPCTRCNGILQVSNYQEIELEADFACDSVCHSNNSFPEFVFTTFMKCNKCTEVISVCGNKTIFFNERNNKIVKKEEYSIKGLSNPISLFKLPKNCPNDIKEVIKQSFSLFWINNVNSCANKIRVSLELIMKEQLTEVEYNSVGEHDLNKRIDIFTRKFPEAKIGRYIKALQYGGNQGSHNGSRSFSHDNILDMYELLYTVLEVLYGDTDSKLDKLSDKIINNKGFISS